MTAQRIVFATGAMLVPNSVNPYGFGRFAAGTVGSTIENCRSIVDCEPIGTLSNSSALT